jgi:hypothetical protein
MKQKKKNSKMKKTTTDQNESINQVKKCRRRDLNPMDIWWRIESKTKCFIC